MKITLLSIELAPSIGLRIIQQLLLDNGHNVKLVFIPMQRVDDEFIEKVAEQLIKFCKDDGLIGISCMANSFIAGSKIIEELKKRISAPIIMGGMHPTFKPEECLEYADYICLGEGEEATFELVEKLEKEKRTDNIKNIWLKKGNKIIKNKLRPPLENLDSLPMPCFDFNYLYAWHNNKILNLEKNPQVIRKFFVFFYNVIASKGCPYSCKYCGNDALCKLNSRNRIIRRRSHEHIFKELRLTKQKLGYFTLCFSDDDFLSRTTEDLKEFFKKYQKEINIPFYCASSPTSLNEEKMKVLVNAGIRRIQIGIQSINDKVNKEIYGRPIGKEQIIKMIKIASKYRRKVLVCYDVILDNPWEKDDTRIETLKFLFTLPKPYEIWLYSIVLYPGTSFYERAKREGLIKDEKEQIYNKSFLAIQNSSLNSLFILFVKFRFSPTIIKILLYLRKFKIIEKLLRKSTYTLLHLHFYVDGFRNSIKRRDFKQFIHYLTAPTRSLIILIEGKKRTKV